ncbi:PP2C family protein-serine/threonine phosphatase [Streptomyces sp. NPDC048338]|uniref:PP2C family protein-serine/threonine phosphatase n=1 Tax=Streptomyces sp. NPDC048338 TaxID=3365536 RepID=UPI0037183056
MSRLHAHPSADAEDLLHTLVRLTGEVLEGIKLQEARVELALALQRQVLPAELPTVPGLAVAARYVPARRGLEIGGDWYDGFVMADGTIGVAIGDVQGHDAEAAAFVGQVRSGLRAGARATTDPGDVLAQVNELLVSMDSGLFVTCSFLRFDPVTHELAGARAGHTPAVWATADAGPRSVLDAGGLPLGMFPGEHYPVTRRVLTTEGAVVLVTDGVVEGPRFPIEDGLEAVAALAHAGFDADADLLASSVIKIADMTGHSDDAAVVVLRHAALSPP